MAMVSPCSALLQRTAEYQTHSSGRTRSFGKATYLERASHVLCLNLKGLSNETPTLSELVSLVPLSYEKLDHVKSSASRVSLETAAGHAALTC